MGEFDKTVPLRKEYPQCGSHIHIFCNLFIFCFWILFSAISHQSQNIFLSVLTLGHPREFWKFLFSNLVFTTPEVYLKGCIHCLSALWQMTPITTTILYDMSGRKKKQRKLVLSKQESTSYSFGTHLSFDCIQFDKKWNGLWGIFLGCILCSLFSWPKTALLVTLPLTHF